MQFYERQLFRNVSLGSGVTSGDRYPGVTIVADVKPTDVSRRADLTNRKCGTTPGKMNFAKAERRPHGWSSSVDRPILFHTYPASLRSPETLKSLLDPWSWMNATEEKEISIFSIGWSFFSFFFGNILLVNDHFSTKTIQIWNYRACLYRIGRNRTFLRE